MRYGVCRQIVNMVQLPPSFIPCVVDFTARWRLCRTMLTTPLLLRRLHIDSVYARGNLTIDRLGQSLPIRSEITAYKGWMSVKKREIVYPTGDTFLFDIMDGHVAVLVMPWNSQNKTFTILEEYCPGPNKILYSVVAGIFEAKHSSISDCARFEAEEEAFLRGGRLIPLLKDENTSLQGSKYSTQTFLPFLLIDGYITQNALPQDENELLQPVSDVSPQDLFTIIQNGQMTGTGVMLSLLSIEMLRKMQQL
ncbi:hydrolase, NUDIX family protein [Cardiosporidium cionae]|uniref:Hydrolase, NUDIX family protein n=1 Tax=Cardiosporidium cionae TaxID=476202 RepID=A0ABQ7JDK5_9APIC|nr:hydrolase, NUDIX family protein [Cardiosporidium cionae]|eukprot:KAF8822084.1 hydrolase, NUDIX family protein [Cardiosporidium cionae]